MTGPSQAPSPYLPPGAARGCAYCLDPDSQLLRQALTAPPPAEHAPIPTGALLDDLRFLHQLMRKQCAGYPDLLRHRDFDPDAFFAQWADTVRRAGAAISCRDGIFDEEVESVGWPVDCYLERIDQDAADLVPHLDSIG